MTDKELLIKLLQDNFYIDLYNNLHWNWNEEFEGFAKEGQTKLNNGLLKFIEENEVKLG